MKKIYWEQRKANKCRTKSGKKWYIALCIVVKYINGELYLQIKYNSGESLLSWL